MISPQDEVNKRRSKALHLLNVAQVHYEDGTIDNIEEFRREAARPDGALKYAPGALRDGSTRIDRNIEVATAQFQLLQESKNEIDLRGPNATMMGEKAQGSSSASGKAIIASQQGGMMEIGELLDALRDLDNRVFRKVWYRIRQFWTAEKWVRVTDDERNVKWVGINISPEKRQQIEMMAQQDPEMAKTISGLAGPIAELECDIIISDVPDAVTPALEQWQGLVELAKAGIAIPPDVLIESAPNLRNKERLLEKMKEASENAPPDPEIAKAQAQMQLKEQEAQANLAIKQQESQANIELKKIETAADIEMEREKNAARMDSDRQAHENKMALAVNGEERKGEQAAAGKKKEYEPVAEIIGTLEKALTAPKRVIRGADGRVEGVETVSA
jgi:hypothetical protein